MFKLFGRRKKNKQPPPQDQQVERNKDIPVAHLMANWSSMPDRDVIKARHPHMVTGYLPKDETPKWENKESRE